jgi:RNA polymerase sigma factor (sigma-70 family)
MPPGRGGNGVRTPLEDGTAGAVAGSLYERYAARIFRVCVDRLGDRDEAADAVQDTFLRAWLALRNGVEVRHPLPWLLTIADSVCVSRFRAQGARVATTQLSDAATVDFPEVGEVAGLTAAFRALPVRQREALLRRELQGYSYDEIGAELGVSRASVAALLHRARLAVADALREARRGIAAIAPIPAVLRAPFEGGAAASGAAVAGTAVVALTQLAGAGPVTSSPQPPARTTEAISMTAPPSARVPVAVVIHSRAHTGRKAPLTREAPKVRGTPGRDTRSGAPRSAAVGVLGETSGAPEGPASADTPLELPNETSGGDAAAAPPEPGPTPTAAAPETSAPAATGDERAAAAPTTTPSPKPRPNGVSMPPGKQPRGARGRSEHAPGHAEKPAPTPTGTVASAALSSSEPADRDQKPGHDAQPDPPGASPADTPPGKADDHPGQGYGQGQGKRPEKVGGEDGIVEEGKGAGQGKPGRPPAVTKP